MRRRRPNSQLPIYYRELGRSLMNESDYSGMNKNLEASIEAYEKYRPDNATGVAFAHHIAAMSCSLTGQEQEELFRICLLKRYTRCWARCFCFTDGLGPIKIATETYSVAISILRLPRNAKSWTFSITYEIGMFPLKLQKLSKRLSSTFSNISSIVE